MCGISTPPFSNSLFLLLQSNHCTIPPRITLINYLNIEPASCLQECNNELIIAKLNPVVIPIWLTGLMFTKINLTLIFEMTSELNIQIINFITRIAFLKQLKGSKLKTKLRATLHLVALKLPCSSCHWQIEIGDYKFTSWNYVEQSILGGFATQSFISKFLFICAHLFK